MDRQDGLDDFVGTMMPLLDERQRRLFLGSLSKYIGHGGGKLLSDITGVSAQTISAGRKEAEALEKDPTAKKQHLYENRSRSPGGGRKKLSEKYPELVPNLFQIMEGGPDHGAEWTFHTTEEIASLLSKKGFDVSHDSIRNLFSELGFSLRKGKRKANPDGRQFSHIIGKMKSSSRDGIPTLYIELPSPGIDGKLTAGPTMGIVKTWMSVFGSTMFPDATEVLIVINGINSLEDADWNREFHRFVEDSKMVLHVSQCPSAILRWREMECTLEYGMNSDEGSEALPRATISLVRMGIESQSGQFFASGEFDVENNEYIEMFNRTFE